ncbi:DNA gyrase subunit A [Marinicella gelatinilytica]|uniref:DNA gyrase subunit A n=1 Tax=Marinicella gelatinilytica TaxID=2996017 RepID=UPI0022608D86|nr:DNA gyrase subunit A [Marinicella gelatinilytica]MCX7544809.1 DNA gyrase subunit A [Marinicella gelatinilytica]
MAENSTDIIKINIEDEMKKSYLDYSMSVIVGRALPDVRDGLKPVHRRVLYAMNVLGVSWNKAHKKSARVVGDVIGKYHPHGDSAVYDTIVRMAQPFSMRYMLVDGQGNFGSVDGDSPAAMRYTEVRMAKISHQMLADIDKDTVDFVANYDETDSEPSVLPTRIPALLVNGSSGIAVGMATNIPPHNLNEVIDAVIALIEKPDISLDEIMTYLPGPDFPTAAFINGAEGIRDAYETGRGKIYMRARSDIEVDEASGKQTIIIDEIPYQVNKARLIEKIAELVKHKKLEGITALRDESDKDGMRIVIELRRGEVGEVILNQLFKLTQLQTVFGINMVALVNGQPRTLSLMEVLNEFVKHRREVVVRRTIFELGKARDRAHILEGLSVALANIEEIIELIKTSKNPAEARDRLLAKKWDADLIKSLLDDNGDLCRPEDLDDAYGFFPEGYQLSPIQAKAILDLQLHRLTGLEQNKISDEFKEIIVAIKEYLNILTNPDRLLEVIREELLEIKDQFGDDRRTIILNRQRELTMRDLVPEEDVVVTLSHAGYAKMQQLDVYRAQARGGKGKSATNMKDDDFIEKLWVANTHDTLLCFSNQGQVYWLKVYELPMASRTARGKPLVNLLPLDKEEKITAILPVRDYDPDSYVFFATAKGVVKKTSLENFSRPRANGIIGLGLLDDDYLVNVEITNGDQDVFLFTSAGKSIRFHESDVRSMGRTARGVKGISMKPGQSVVSMFVAEEGQVLTCTEHGFGKQTKLEEFSRIRRGGQGVIAIQTSERNGRLVGACQVLPDDQVMLISDGGTLVRTSVSGISTVGRNTQGVTLIRLSKGESLVGLAKIINMDDEGGEDDELTDLQGAESNQDAEGEDDA